MASDLSFVVNFKMLECAVANILRNAQENLITIQRVLHNLAPYIALHSLPTGVSLIAIEETLIFLRPSYRIQDKRQLSHLMKDNISRCHAMRSQHPMQYRIMMWRATRISEGNTEIYRSPTSEVNDLLESLIDVSQITDYLIPLRFWSTQRANRSLLPHLQHPV